MNFPQTVLRHSKVLFVMPLIALVFASCSTVKVLRDEERAVQHALESVDLLEAAAPTDLPAIAAIVNGSRDLLKEAFQLEKHNAPGAAGRYLESALEARQSFLESGASSRSDSAKALLNLYNSSLSRFAELWLSVPADPSTGTREFRRDSHLYTVSLSPSSTYPADFFDRYLAADSLKEKGIKEVSRAGIGAALVGSRLPSNERAEEMLYYSFTGLHLPVTMLIDSSTQLSDNHTSVVLSLIDPLVQTEITFARQQIPTAADFSSPAAVTLNRQNQSLRGLEGFFDAQNVLARAGIYLTAPYDPDRIPVLFIHGLVSAPIIWRDMVTELIADPEIAKRYQFMVFAYPSGLPLLESSALLRQWLADIREDFDPKGNDPLSSKLLVVGHSMGGILAHTLGAEIGDRLWQEFNSTPLDDMDIDAEEKESLRQLVYFDPDPGVSRIVYIATPHRGSKLAERKFSTVLSKAAKLPIQAVQTLDTLLDPQVSENVALEAMRKGTYTSAQSLTPGAPMITALDKSPYRKGIVYHSIIGDQGRGDTPNSSDGIVDYWSSHLDGAASELIVPTNHRAYEDPAAVEEMKRILRLHAGL